MTGKCKKLIIIVVLSVISLTLVYAVVSKKPASEEISDKKIYDTYTAEGRADGECFLCVTIDLVATGLTAWVSPELRADFARAEGPMPVMQSTEKSSFLEEDILNIFLSCAGKSEEGWKVSLAKETASVTAALLVPENMPQTTKGNCVQLVQNMLQEQYLVLFDHASGELIGQPIRERGISQLCFFEDGIKLYIGMIYENSFAGWEDYSMKWLCLEEGAVKRVESVLENGNPYNYWKNRKAVFDGDNTISVFVRESTAGTFEELVQNRELMAMEHYTDYVPEYHWMAENEFSVVEWLEGGLFSEDGNAAIDEMSSVGRNIPTSPELLSMLFNVDETGILPNPTYFSVGFAGATVEIYPDEEGKTELTENPDNAYFIVKKYGGSHQAGFQSLYIGSLDIKSGKIVQCLSYSGDHSQAEMVSYGDAQYILFYAESMNNGAPTTVGGIWRAEAGRLLPVWPYAAENAEDAICENYWHPCGCAMENEDSAESGNMLIHRTARLENGKLEIYRIDFIFEDDSTYFPVDYSLIFEGEIGVEDLVAMEHVPDI